MTLTSSPPPAQKLAAILGTKERKQAHKGMRSDESSRQGKIDLLVSRFHNFIKNSYL